VLCTWRVACVARLRARVLVRVRLCVARSACVRVRAPECAGRGVGNTSESRVAQSGSSSRSGAFSRTVFSSGALFAHAGAP